MDNTKRKAIENVVKQGIFSFDLNGKVYEISETEEIPQDVLEMVWRDQKLTAIDNPYVTILMLKPIFSYILIAWFSAKALSRTSEYPSCFKR
ncbi:hypothetical protein AKG34_11275 [Peribacillus butanolivorans]|uniref:hypothetical protein n=1 Tax=Peribacillus butanolivorans TaxID=421767 RepID=UPI0006A6CBCB|nr:hypothetical protein [Peribacillus butanolivorans]KON69288.1 hypothetical protein AKG34_11275 [Peribacillus butanolivorans]